MQKKKLAALLGTQVTLAASTVTITQPMIDAPWQAQHGVDNKTDKKVESLHTKPLGNDLFAIRQGEDGDETIYSGAELRVAMAGEFGKQLGIVAGYPPK